MFYSFTEYERPLSRYEGFSADLHLIPGSGRRLYCRRRRFQSGGDLASHSLSSFVGRLCGDTSGFVCTYQKIQFV